jgi:hypothetical protein
MSESRPAWRADPINDLLKLTHRRFYARTHDGSPGRDSVSIAIDVTNATFSWE